MKYYLYRHIRLDKNQPFYIGIGTKPDIVKGKIHEYSRAFSKTQRNKFWHNITNKTTYEVEILFECDDYNFIQIKEIEFISIYGRICNKSGILVNFSEGGNSRKGFIHSQEVKNKISKGNKGKIMSQESRDRLSKSTKGRIISKEQRINISKALIGKKQSKETIEKRKISNKGKLIGRKTSEEVKKKQSLARLGKRPLQSSIEKSAKSRWKSVHQYDLKGNFIREWESLKNIEVTTGFFATEISRCCNNKQNHYKKFLWKFKQNNHGRS
jgi:hypothetical protein